MKARFFALAALVLGLASCQKDFDGASTLVGGEVDFQLSVGTEEMTRADLDGDEQEGYNSAYGAIDYLSAADWAKYDLRYSLEVYDVANDYTNATPIKDRMVIIVDDYQPVAFDLRLVPNRDYHFVVFADFVPQNASNDANTVYQSNLGLRHNIGATLGDITIKEDAINDEIADAYFATKDIKISNSAAQSIVLKRPYGKVRVIATDLADLNLNVNPDAVKVAYTAKHPQKFNAVTGKIDEYADEVYEFVYDYEAITSEVNKGGLQNHLYTADYDAKTATNANNVERHTHMTLFTDYILAADQTPIHFTMTVYDNYETRSVIKETVFNTDVPVERNMLTTVIGNVLTTATEINVTIDDNFNGRHEVNYIGVASARELQEVLKNVKAGEINVINFEADIDAVKENINIIEINELAETTIILNGNDYKFNGCFQIKGNSEYKNAHSVFQNIKFETADASKFRGDAFIFCDDEPNTSYRYPDCVTIKECSFTATGAAEKKTVGAKLWSLENNFVVENCRANGMHSMVQLTSCGKADVTINGATIENSKNGFGLGQVATATIKDININAAGYGIRLDGATSSTTTIERATIEAFIPVNVRKMNDEAYNVVVKFVDNAIGLKGNTYEVAFCANEYEEGVVPQNPVGTFTLENAEEARAFYGTVTSFSAFDAAINSTNNPKVEAEGNITKVGVGVEVERNVEIDFQNYEFNAGSDANSRWYALEIIGEYDVTINNANFTRAGVYASGADVVFNSGVINHKPERSSRYIFCAQNGSTITINDGTFNNDRENNAYFWADNATVIVNGGNFGGVASKNKVILTNGGQVIITGGTFNFDPSAWVLPSSVVTKNGANWVVTPLPVSNNISDAVANVEDGGTIVLAEGNYTMPSTGGKDVTIVGNENTVINVGAPNAGAGNVTLHGVTIKAGQYKGFQHSNVVTYNDVTIEGELFCYGAKDIFNNCTFKLNNGYVWTYGSKETVFNNCTFNTNGKAILVYNEGAGASNVTVNNCTFNATAGAKAGDIANQNCAAIEINNYQNSGVGVAHNVTTSNNTVNDNFSGEWRIKKFVSGAAITVNGVAYETIALDGKAMTIDADKNVTVL